jgi:hypothetical protein
VGLRPLEERFRLRSSSYAGTRRPDKSLEVGGEKNVKSEKPIINSINQIDPAKLPTLLTRITFYIYPKRSKFDEIVKIRFKDWMPAFAGMTVI